MNSLGRVLFGRAEMPRYTYLMEASGNSFCSVSTNQLELQKDAFKLNESKHTERAFDTLAALQRPSDLYTFISQIAVMSSAALLGEDFGSESEDDNFNPAPAEDSDNDAAGDSDEEVNVKTNGHGAEQWQRPSKQQASEDEEDDAEASPVNGRQSNGQGSRRSADQEDEGKKGNRAGRLNVAEEGDDDEDEDEEEEEDEEEAISVGLHALLWY